MIEKDKKVTAEPAADGEYKNGKTIAVEKTDGLTNESVSEIALTEISKPPQEPEFDQLSFGEMKVKGDICPTCGVGAMVYQEGCSKCYACGHSEC